MTYRGRFAPTPSGPLHFGSIVAATGSYLQARRAGGQWYVRIDDLDPPRVVPGAADAILRTLERLGFEWDDKVIYQSRRRDAYHAALHRLRTAGALYPCACTRRQIALSSRTGIDGPIYPGTCREGMKGRAAARAWRIATCHARTSFEDAVLGRRSYDIEAQFGDFILYRSDTVYAFHLASAVDDAQMKISEVVRGRDLLQSSARQHWLIERLGFPAPGYAHLPLVVHDNGQKLSKQTHAAPARFQHPAVVIRHALSFLGQQPPQNVDELGEIWGWARANWRIESVPRMAGAMPDGEGGGARRHGASGQPVR